MENSSTTPKKHAGFGKWALVVAIVIVLNLFFNYAISLVYKEPSYTAYVPTSQVIQPISDENDCLAVGGQWMAVPAPQSVTDGKNISVLGSCDPNYTKEQQYQAAQTAYSRNVFIILVILGVASLVLGAVMGSAVLAISFSWGGVLSLLIAAMRYWSDASGFVKLVVLAAALSALIWVAVKKMGDPK